MGWVRCALTLMWLEGGFFFVFSVFFLGVWIIELFSRATVYHTFRILFQSYDYCMIW